MVKSFTNTYAEGAKILSTLPKVWTLKVNHSKSLLVTSTMECLTRRQVALITTQRPLRGSATPLIGSVSDRERRRRLVSAQHHGSQEYRPHFFPSLLLIKNQNMVSRSIGSDDSERHCVVLSRAAKARSIKNNFSRFNARRRHPAAFQSTGYRQRPMAARYLKIPPARRSVYRPFGRGGKEERSCGYISTKFGPESCVG
jgi:hypothetical protein